MAVMVLRISGKAAGKAVTCPHLSLLRRAKYLYYYLVVFHDPPPLQVLRSLLQPGWRPMALGLPDTMYLLPDGTDLRLLRLRALGLAQALGLPGSLMFPDLQVANLCLHWLAHEHLQLQSAGPEQQQQRPSSSDLLSCLLQCCGSAAGAGVGAGGAEAAGAGAGVGPEAAGAGAGGAEAAGAGVGAGGAEAAGAGTGAGGAGAGASGLLVARWQAGWALYRTQLGELLPSWQASGMLLLPSLTDEQ